MPFTDGDIETIYTQAIAAWPSVNERRTHMELLQNVPDWVWERKQVENEGYYMAKLFGLIQPTENTLDFYQIGCYQMAYDLEGDILFVKEPAR